MLIKYTFTRGAKPDTEEKNQTYRTVDIFILSTSGRHATHPIRTKILSDSSQPDFT